jgi:hypothetical protein
MLPPKFRKAQDVLTIVLLGMVIVNAVRDCSSAKGVLKIDHSNPEKDVYRFEIDRIESLNKKKRVVLKVDHNAVLR